MNPGLGDIHEGYYITTLKMVQRFGKHGRMYLATMTPAEKRAFIKTVSETLMLVGVSLLISGLFGWDPDDEDRFEKLREKSGALPFLFTTEDPRYDWHLGGWMSNQGLQLAMQIRSENEQFVPWPTFGLDEYASLLDVKSLAFGPTLDAYERMFTLGVGTAMGNENAYYKRRVGPYDWQQEGGSKFIANLAKTLGLTGQTLDPVQAIQNFKNIEQRRK
jgi:hypothetical protein